MQDLMASEDHNRNIVEEISQLWIQGELCDVNLCVEDILIPAHRVVLAAVSPYFKAMFCSPLDERYQSIISMQGLNSVAVKAVVEFAYTGKLDLKNDSVQTIMQTAAMMQVLPIVQMCSHFLSECLHPSNCLGFRAFAKSLGSPELFDFADKYCEENFSELSLEEEFLNLEVDEVIGLVVRDSLKVTKEEEVYAAVMRWVEYDPKRAKVDAVRIMEHVRLPLVDWHFLTKKVSKDELFMTNEGCRDYLQQARAFQASSFHPDLINFAFNEAVLRSNPRTSFLARNELYSIGGETVDRQLLSSFESFTPLSEQAKQLPPLPEAKRSLGMVFFNNTLYVIGGATERQTSQSVHAFNFEKQQWKSRGELCIPRSSLVALVINGEITVFGGHGEYGVLMSVEKYDEDLNSWHLVSDMLEVRGMAAGAVMGDCVYLCGGYDGQVDLSSCHMWDEKNKQWSVCSDLLESRSLHGAGVMQNKLYVAGGINRSGCLSSVEVYNPGTNQWTSVLPMPGPRRGLGLSVLGDSLYAAGGHDGSAFMDTLFKLNATTGEWTTNGNLITERGRFGFL